MGSFTNVFDNIELECLIIVLKNILKIPDKISIENIIQELGLDDEDDLTSEVISDTSEITFDDLKRLPTYALEAIGDDNLELIDTETEFIPSPLPQKIIDDKARIIQHFFRLNRRKNLFKENFYNTYLSLFLSTELHQLKLSSIMFGRHQAEILQSEPYHIQNPYIENSDFYHRVSKVSDTLLNQLLAQYMNHPLMLASFTITTDTQKNTIHPSISQNIAPENVIYFPFSKSGLTPINELINAIHAKMQIENPPLLEIIEDSNHTIGIIKIPMTSYGDEFENYLIISGIKASPWEIAANLHQMPDIYPEQNFIDNLVFPDSLIELYNHKIYKNLLQVSQGNYVSKNLAIALQQLLENSPHFSPAAIKRIALMLDIANTFYKNNYSQYFHYLYAIVHELSLALLEEQNEYLTNLFADFQVQSKNFLLCYLDLEEENIKFMAIPALSGSHAHLVALNIAQKLAKTNEVNVLNPSYFEFEGLRTSSQTSSILAISTGPIFTENGLETGLDLNLFIKLKASEYLTSIILIDSTTTLYKNLKLDEEAKNMIKEGRVSLIFYESRQKFGLLHTDQAQYGQVYVLSTIDLVDEIITETLPRALDDFYVHPDLRIGVYISSRCNEILETIKSRHFFNATLLNQTLFNKKTKNLTESLYGLENLDELYFIVNSTGNLIFNIIDLIGTRASFGHFATTQSNVSRFQRISPGASDDIDTLILGSMVYLLNKFRKFNKNELKQLSADFLLVLSQLKENPPTLLLSVFKSAINIATPLTLDKQIVLLALANLVLHFIQPESTQLKKQELVEIYKTLENILNVCEDLKGREHFSHVQNNYFKFKRIIQNQRNTQDAFLSTRINDLFYTRSNNEDENSQESFSQDSSNPKTR